MEKSSSVLVTCLKVDCCMEVPTMTRKQESVSTDSTSNREIYGDWEAMKSKEISKSNYILFKQRWQRREQYPLPNSFQLLNISDKSAESINNQYQWFNFSILSYSCQQLSQIAGRIISQNGFSVVCTASTINRIVTEICQQYNVVSYHNFSHGFSLMHMLFQLTKLDPKFRNMFTSEQIGYCLIAALGHDIKHPGTNNNFQIKLNTDLAREASNQSVLEKMHVKTLFNTLGEKNLDIFAKSSNPKKMKDLMTRVILSTDVSKHFKNLQKLKSIVSTRNQTENEQNKYFFMEQAFHACDIGNPCLQYQEYMNWAALLSYQFNTQTLLETQHKVQVTQMLKYTSKKGFYQSQVGFIKNLVYPLWKQLSETWNGFSFLVENIETNLKLLQIKADNQIQSSN